jgi:hypothetical protein
MQLPPIAISELASERGMDEAEQTVDFCAHNDIYRILRLDDAKVGR